MSLSKFPEKARRAASVAIVAALALLTAACTSSQSAAPLVCPTAAIAPGLNVIPQFGPGGGREPSDVRVSGILTSIKNQCDRTDKGIAIHAIIGLLARRVSTDVKVAQLPYFVAVADTQQHILQKRRFILNVRFQGDEAYHNSSDDITIYLPLKTVSAGGDYIVLTGFQLSKSQLDFVRSHRQQ